MSSITIFQLPFSNRYNFEDTILETSLIVKVTPLLTNPPSATAPLALEMFSVGLVTS